MDIKRKLKDFGIKKIAIAVVIIALLILVLVSLKTSYTFHSGFDKIKKLDTKYETNFSEEMLNGTLINYKNVDPYLNDLKLLREDVYSSINDNPTKEESALLRFIDIRTLMLLSEKQYTLAKTIGPKGFTADEDGFACSESGYIINVAYHLNLSASAGVETITRLDELMSDFRDVPRLWDLIGINTKAPRFFFSPLGDIKNHVRRNLIALEEFCLIDTSKGLTGTVNPDDYKNTNPNQEADLEVLKKRFNNEEEFKKFVEEKGLNITYSS